MREDKTNVIYRYIENYLTLNFKAVASVDDRATIYKRIRQIELKP